MRKLREWKGKDMCITQEGRCPRTWRQTRQGPWKVKDDVQLCSPGHPKMRCNGGKVNRLTSKRDQTDRQKHFIAAGDTGLELGHKSKAGQRGITSIKAHPGAHASWGRGTVA